MVIWRRSQKQKSANKKSGSPWAPISVCPPASQQRLGPFYEGPESPGLTIPLSKPDYIRAVIEMSNAESPN
jgi:hypothetical protein